MYKLVTKCLAALMAVGVLASSAWAAEYVEPARTAVALSQEEIVDLVAPIALYPDDLLAVVLPAATYPLQIVLAGRYLEDRANGANLEPEDDWDESIIALLNYPEVLQKLRQDIDWTWQLGDAVLEQHEDVLAAVTEFRQQAIAAGNLSSDDKQTVEVADQHVVIQPVSQTEIYVPNYDPYTVIHTTPRRVYHYYERPYSVYYYPYGPSHRFGAYPHWSVNTWFGIHWANQRIHRFGHRYRHHPYYGHRYHHRRFGRVSYPHYRYRHDGSRFYAGTRWQRGPSQRVQHRAARRYGDRYDRGSRRATQAYPERRGAERGLRDRGREARRRDRGIHDPAFMRRHRAEQRFAERGRPNFRGQGQNRRETRAALGSEQRATQSAEPRRRAERPRRAENRPRRAENRPRRAENRPRRAERPLRAENRPQRSENRARRAQEQRRFAERRESRPQAGNRRREQVNRSMQQRRLASQPPQRRRSAAASSPSPARTAPRRTESRRAEARPQNRARHSERRTMRAARVAPPRPKVAPANLGGRKGAAANRKPH